MECASIVLYSINSIILCTITNVFKDFLYFYSLFSRSLSSIFRYISHDDSFVKAEGQEDVRAQNRLSVEAAEVVMKRLGMLHLGEEVKRWRENIYEFLEEKEASFEELKEAFYVFDRDEDGFISPAELWSVMRRLGMREGMRMEDCVRMISVFDDDGDGRISLLEFKTLLENAV